MNMRTKVFFVGVISIVCLFALSTEIAQTEASGAPIIISAFPTNNATNAGLGAVSTLTFSEALDPASVNTTNIKLATTVGNSAVPFTTNYTPGTTLVTITPTGDLKPGISYTLSVTTGIKDTTATPLAAPYATTFTTGFIKWHAGAYILGNVDQNVVAADGFLTSESSTYATGFAMRASWVLLEGAGEGIYNWTPLDANLNVLKSKGKKVSLAVFPFQPVRITSGCNPSTQDCLDFFPHPSWVRPSQTYYALFKDDKNCRAYPVPWDPVVNEKWLNFLRALARHLAEANLLDTVSYVNGAGDAITLNWGIHNQILKTYSDPSCTVSTTWSALGYTSQKMIDVIKQNIDAFAHAFPDKIQWFSVGDIVMTPQLDPSKSYVAQESLNYGLARYPDRFGLWREDLSAKRLGKTPPPSESIWELMSKYRPKLGAQMIAPAGGTTMSVPGTAKDVALRTAIEIGSSNDTGSVDGTPDGYYVMPYQEIYQLDVADADPLMIQVFKDATTIFKWQSDATPPSIPSTPSASAITTSSVTLSWSASTDRWDKTNSYTDSLTNVVDYWVYLGTTQGGKEVENTNQLGNVTTYTARMQQTSGV
ncbi:MAG: Ig-like domain-containing protein [bacterium]|nr:Ig-like domain-containing protein [bacterium]MDZ4284239.1 Ig-like domain-containing protein [Patescibacteria group bacterium]